MQSGVVNCERRKDWRDWTDFHCGAKRLTWVSTFPFLG
jgi:hypothetical protein